MRCVQFRTSETHIKLQFREISFVPTIRCCCRIALTVYTEHGGEIAVLCVQFLCKRLGNWRVIAFQTDIRYCRAPSLDDIPQITVLLGWMSIFSSLTCFVTTEFISSELRVKECHDHVNYQINQVVVFRDRSRPPNLFGTKPLPEAILECCKYDP